MFGWNEQTEDVSWGLGYMYWALFTILQINLINLLIKKKKKSMQYLIWNKS